MWSIASAAPDVASSTRESKPASSLQQNSNSSTPPQGLLSSFDLFISNCRRNINRLNLSPTEHAALCSNPKLTIKPTGKRGAVVVWRTNLYIAEARHQLSDISSYHPLDHDPNPDHQNIISQTIHNLITSGDLPPTASNLI
eukprot:g25723.t1